MIATLSTDCGRFIESEDDTDLLGCRHLRREFGEKSVKKGVELSANARNCMSSNVLQLTLRVANAVESPPTSKALLRAICRPKWSYAQVLRSESLCETRACINTALDRITPQTIARQ